MRTSPLATAALGILLSVGATTATQEPAINRAERVRLGMGERFEACLPGAEGTSERTTLAVRMDGMIELFEIATGKTITTACGVGMSRKNTSGVSKFALRAIKQGNVSSVELADGSTEKVVISCEPDALVIDLGLSETKRGACSELPAEPIPPPPPVATLTIPMPKPAPTSRPKEKDDQI